MTRFSRSRDLLRTFLRLFKRDKPQQLELPLPQAKPQKPEKAQEKPKETPKIVRSELNLERNAVFTASSFRGKSRTVIRRYETKNGVLERRVEIGRTASGVEVGVLTTTHFKVYLVLLELWEKAGRPIHEPVHFTVLRILKRLKLPYGGSNYETILKSLASLSDTPIRFIDSFSSKDGSVKSTGHLSILSYLHIYERTAKTKTGGKTYGYGEFTFDNHILMSLIDNFTHPLRLDVITAFKKHRDMAVLLYIYLDRQLAFRRKFEITLGKLYDQLDLSQRYIKYPSQRKLKLEPVLEELEGSLLSTGKLSSCRIEKTADDIDYKLVARKTGVTQIPQPEPVNMKLDWGKIPLEDLLERVEKK